MINIRETVRSSSSPHSTQSRIAAQKTSRYMTCDHLRRAASPIIRLSQTNEYIRLNESIRCEAFPQLNCRPIRQYAWNGPVIILVSVRLNRPTFDEDIREKRFVVTTSFPVTRH